MAVKDDTDQDTGWSEWATEQTNDLLDRIVQQLITSCSGSSTNAQNDVHKL